MQDDTLKHNHHTPEKVEVHHNNNYVEPSSQMSPMSSQQSFPKDKSPKKDKKSNIPQSAPINNP